jgi:hypothetical protein
VFAAAQLVALHRRVGRADVDGHRRWNDSPPSSRRRVRGTLKQLAKRWVIGPEASP